MKKTPHGFSLVELVLVITFIGILSLVLGAVVNRGVKSYDLLWSRRTNVAKAQVAMDRMVMEMRLIERPSDILDISSATKFQFEYPNNTVITYELVGTNLLRNSDILASGIQALDFQYFTANGTVTTNPITVRRVQVQLTATAPADHGTLTLQSYAIIRSGMDHYDAFAIQ